jgi:hypothetical protein
LRTAVAFDLARRVAEVVGSADRKLTIERRTDVVGGGSREVAFGSADPIDTEATVAVVVRPTDGNGRVRVRKRSGPAEARVVTDFARLVAAFLAASETDALHAVGREVGALAAVDALAEDGSAKVVLASRSTRTIRVRPAEKLAAIVCAGESGRTLEVVLTRFGDRRACVVYAKVARVAVPVGEAGADSLRAARIAEVALEPVAAVAVGDACRNRRDVAPLIRRVAVAPDRTVAVREAHPEIERDAFVRVDVAETVERAVEVGKARYLDYAVDGIFGPVDGASGEEEPDGQEHSDA